MSYAIDSVTSSEIVKANIVGPSGDVAEVLTVDGAKALAVGLPGKESSNNSSSALLPGGETFTGASDDVSDFAVIIVSVHADQASATNGLKFQWSTDNLHWDTSDTYTIAAGVLKTFTVQPIMRYFRVVYVNGAAVQTDFHLVTQYRQMMVKASSHRMGDDISGEDDAELVKAILAAERPGTAGIYTNVQATNSGNLKISLEEFESGISVNSNAQLRTTLYDPTGVAVDIAADGAVAVEDRMLAIAEGEVTGHSLMLKFGRNPDIDTGAAEDVWEGGGLYTFDTTAQSLEVVSDDVNDDGAPASTGARTVTVIGLDANYASKTETVTMNGTTPVALSGTWMRVHRCSVTTAGSSEVNEGTLTVRLAGAGATRLVVRANNGQTLMAVYTIPAGKTGYLFHYYVTGNASPTAPTMDVSFWTRSSTGVRNLKHQQAVSAGEGLTYNFAAPFKITEKTDVWLRATSNVNNTDVCGGFDLVLVDN